VEDATPYAVPKSFPVSLPAVSPIPGLTALVSNCVHFGTRFRVLAIDDRVRKTSKRVNPHSCLFAGTELLVQLEQVDHSLELTEEGEGNARCSLFRVVHRRIVEFRLGFLV